MASGIYRLALEHRARGGTPESFMAIAKSQVAHAFEIEDPSNSKGNLPPKETSYMKSRDNPKFFEAE